MTQARVHARSFAGGEITPELYGRLDLTKHQTGLKQCKNAIVLPHGPVQRRSGFDYVLRAKDDNTPVKLLRFNYNAEQSYVIEAGNGYFRFHTDEATVLSASQPLTSITSAFPVGVATYTGADPANGTWVYITGVAGMTEVNGRFVKVASVDAVAKTFELHDLDDNPIDTSGYAAGTGGQFSPVYELPTPYASSDLGDLNYAQNADIMTITHPNHPVKELTRTSPATFTLTDAVFAPQISEPQTVAAVIGSATGIGLTLSYDYVVTAVDEDNFEESVASTSSTVGSQNLGNAGNYNSITWTAPVTGTPTRYNVYRKDQSTGNSLFGYIGQTDGLSFDDQNIVPDMSTTPPVIEDPFASAGNYPGAVSYFEQRKVFGRTNSKKQNYWFTRSGTEWNLARSLPVQANDSIQSRIVAREVNEIRHFVSLSDLLVLTVGGEWVITSSDGGGLTPGTLRVRPQSYQGSSKIIPEVTGNSVLYVQADKARVHEIKYSWESSSYLSSDVSLLAPHLVDGFTLVGIAHMSQPHSVLWCVRSDGALLGMTYVPEHEVIGWHQHDTDGGFKSITTISEDGHVSLYAVVRREVNGNTVQYIEHMHPFHNAQEGLADYFGVDSGLSFDGVATDTFSGLWHLEGKTVSILGDGAVFPDQVVTNGSVTIGTPVAKAHIGLSYTPVIELLPGTLTQAPAGGQALSKSSTDVYLRVHRSSGILIGKDLDNLHRYAQRTTEPYGSPPELISEEIRIVNDDDWDQDGSVIITQENPLPMTLVSLVNKLEVGG